MGNKGIKDQERLSFSVAARETPHLWMVKKLAKGRGHKWPAVAWECGQLGGGPEVPRGLRAPLKQPTVAEGTGWSISWEQSAIFWGLGRAAWEGVVFLLQDQSVDLYWQSLSFCRPAKEMFTESNSRITDWGMGGRAGGWQPWIWSWDTINW